MNSDFLAIKTSPDLLRKLRNAQPKKSSAHDILEQRVSYVFGALAQDSGVTRERVRQVLIEQAGGTGSDAK
jgi:phage antirepressor YoqD-like protein